MQSHSRQLRCCQHLFRQAMRRIENSFSRTVRPDTRKRAAFLPEKPLLVFEHAFSPPAPLMLEAKVCDANLRRRSRRLSKDKRRTAEDCPPLRTPLLRCLKRKFVTRTSGGGAEGFRTRKKPPAQEFPSVRAALCFCVVRPQRSHLSQSESICEAKRARSLFVPPLLCSMTVSRRFPAASRRVKVLCARRAA